MLSKALRLTRKKDFEILFKEGRFFAGKCIHMQVWAVEPEKYPRRAYDTNTTKIGFIVSKKVSRSAVKRNRIKRVMRECTRLVIKDATVRGGYMIAFMATPRAADIDTQSIAKDISQHITRLKLVQK